jgi:membrane fusion protein, multidrug efflux system
LRTERDVMTIPSGSIQRGATGLYVYRATPDNTAEIQPVEVGPYGDKVAVINAGLHLGDRVVTAGQYRLQPGARIAVAADAPAAKPEKAAEVTR